MHTGRPVVATSERQAAATGLCLVNSITTQRVATQSKPSPGSPATPRVNEAHSPVPGKAVADAQHAAAVGAPHWPDRGCIIEEHRERHHHEHGTADGAAAAPSVQVRVQVRVCRLLHGPAHGPAHGTAHGTAGDHHRQPGRGPCRCTSVGARA